MIYLIQRGPRPDYHRAPYHPVIICDLKRIAEWQADWTGEGASVWKHEPSRRGGGWLLTRWRGLDIDYGHVVRGGSLFDGGRMGFAHDEDAPPWSLLNGAVWWSSKRMPDWLKARGVVYPPDEFSQQEILDREADDGMTGFGRPCPAHWPEGAPGNWELCSDANPHP